MKIAESPSAVLWPLPLDVRYIDGENWELRSDFQFVSPNEGRYPSLLLAAGFITDFASIPRAFWNLMEPTDRRIGKAAVIHDAYYRTRSLAVTKDAADAMLRDGMQALGAGWLVRQTAYWAVHRFGTGAYRPRIEGVK